MSSYLLSLYHQAVAKAVHYRQFGPLSSKTCQVVWQQAGQWARKLSRCPVWALLPWSNLSLPALHEITSLSLSQSQLAQDLCCQVHQGSTQTSQQPPAFGDMQWTPCTSCPCSATAGFVYMVTVPSLCGQWMGNVSAFSQYRLNF